MQENDEVCQFEAWMLPFHTWNYLPYLFTSTYIYFVQVENDPPFCTQVVPGVSLCLFPNESRKTPTNNGVNLNFRSEAEMVNKVKCGIHVVLCSKYKRFAFSQWKKSVFIIWCGSPRGSPQATHSHLLLTMFYGWHHGCIYSFVCLFF